MSENIIKQSAYVISVIALFSGCAVPELKIPGVSESGYESAHKATMDGNFTLAAECSDKDKDFKSKLDESNQLPTLYSGNSYMYCNDYESSLKRLEEAEAIVKYHNEEILLGSAGDLIAQLLLNDAVIDYHATMNDAIMLNTYKAINYMALGEMGKARIEFNRAIDRQRRAKETYAKLISKKQEAMNKKQADEKNKLEAKNKSETKKKSNVSLDFDKTLKNPEIDKMIANKYPSLNNFEKYPDFVNPFTNYMAGIFFATQKDYLKSADILKEVYGMSKKSKHVKEDLVMVENILDHKKTNGKKTTVNNVWVVYSNGLAPKKEQFRIDVPLFLFTDKISYTGISLPKMVQQELATKNLTVFNKNKLLSQSESFASMDRVVLTEFEYGYKDVVTRAVFSSLIKTYMQYELQRNMGAMAGLAAGVFQRLSTQADTRTWGNLPKEYQISRIKMPKDKSIQIKVGSENINLDLGDSKNAIVFVRKPSAVSKASYSVIKL